MTFISPARRVNKTIGKKKTHHYVDASGARIPGVTTLINEGLPKPGLTNWAANVTADYAVNNWEYLADMGAADRLKLLRKARFEDLNAASKRGTEVHHLAEQLIKGQEVLVPDDLRGHVESYVRFLDKWQPEPVIVEKSVFHYRHGYAGTLDMVVDLPDGRRVLADIKTSRKGIYGETALQLAAYQYAEVYADDGTEKAMLEVDCAWAIWVRADDYDIVPVSTSLEVFDDFRRVAAVARASKRIPNYIQPILEG